MTIYVLICLSLSLAGVAGLQFFYLAYLERVENEHKRRIRELEHHCKKLTHKLQNAELQINEQTELIDSFYGDEPEDKEEIWADVIEDA
jgi:16S rRNA C1402 (ribose-2'-O) methylase RsmI